MANCGPNTNGSQFFICFHRAKWLDGKHVVFGKVTKGFDILRTIQKYGTENGETNLKVYIENSGEL